MRYLSGLPALVFFLAIVNAVSAQQDATAKTPFLQRYHAFCVIRTLYEAKVPGLSEDLLLNMTAVFLDQHDMADFPIESFRQWKRWEYTDRIMKMYEKKPFDKPVFHVAMLRFALQSPHPEAAAFVAKMRKKDSEWVQDVEEILKEELKPAPK